MNWRAIIAIVGKDLKVIARSKGVLIPLIIVPLILTVALPASLAALPYLAQFADVSSLQNADDWLEQMPPSLQTELRAYDMIQRTIVLTVVYYLAPFFLILPMMVASVIAADSIAGEKERKTLEALLYTPTTDSELFVAKVLAACIPAIAVTWGGFLVYGITVNAAAWPSMGRIFFPNAMWLVLVFWVAPAVAGLGLGFTVAISSRVSSYQEAYQLGSIVIIPIVALIAGQAAGLLYFSPPLAFVVGLGFWVVDFVLLWYGGRVFRRQRLAQQI